MTLSDHVTVIEAGRLLGMSPGGVRKAIQQGRLASVKISPRVLLVPRAEVERYRRERRPAGRPRTIPSDPA